MTAAYKIGTIFYATKACEFYEVVAATPNRVGATPQQTATTSKLKNRKAKQCGIRSNM